MSTTTRTTSTTRTIRPTCTALVDGMGDTTTAKTLRPDQVEAHRLITKALRDAERCQYIAACGTGKTLVTQRVSEVVVPKGLVVVVLPTIALLSQTLRAWTADAAPGRGFEYLAVCSDPSVEADQTGEGLKVEEAEEANLVGEFGGKVVIDPVELRDRLRALPRKGRFVIFGTHASAGRLAQAMLDTDVTAGLLVVDEAHRAASVVEVSETATNAEPSLGEVVTSLLPATKRVFATATPRLFRTEPADGEQRDIFSMSDDPAGPFGEVAYKLSFAEAAEMGLLVDYDIAVLVADSDEIAALIAANELVDLDGKPIPAGRVAAHAGVIEVAHRVGATRVLCFHSSISNAELFASEHPLISKVLHPDEQIWAGAISAKNNAIERSAAFHSFAPEAFPAPPGTVLFLRPERSYLSNVKICTEGIDIKAIDAVAFIDPKTSVVDIAQAVGRAMRHWTDPDTGTVKQRGTIIIPVVLPPGADVDTYLGSTAYQKIRDVLDAMKAVDGRLEDLLIEDVVGRTRNGGCGTGGPKLCPECGRALYSSEQTCPWCHKPLPAAETVEDTSPAGPPDGSEPPAQPGVPSDMTVEPPGDRTVQPDLDDQPGKGPGLPPRLFVFGAAELAAQLRAKIIEHSVRSFDLRVHALAGWVNAHDGQMPRLNGAKDPVERRHGQFLSKCRTAARGGQGASTFSAERRALLDRLVPGWEGVDPETVFTQNVHALADWVNTHDGRMPLKMAKDPVERRHGQFLGYCRQAARGGQGASAFTAERRALLDRLVPGWEGEHPDTIFGRNVHELADWVNGHNGQMPRLSGAKDPVERRHGKFLSGCRTAARGGQGASTFSAERRALLDRLVPGWEGEDPDTIFGRNVHELADWVNAHNGQMPRLSGAKDPVERRHGSFLSRCRTAARGGQGASTFSAERRALLDRLVPGWEGQGRR